MYRMRVLIIDQFVICREGMKAVLLKIDEKCDFLEADSIEEGVASAGELNLDLITINLDVPEIGSLGMLSKIEKLNLKGNILLFSSLENYTIMRKAYEMGISAFIGEQTKKEITNLVFQIVLAGGKYFSPEIIGSRLDFQSQSQSSISKSPKDQPILSNRQFDVLRLMAEGKTNKDIARELNIAAGTVKVHIWGIFKSLKATNRTQAVSIANHINIL